MGNLAQEQGDSNFRRNDRSDKSCSDGHSRLVRSNSVQCLEESISNNPHQYQKRGSGIGSSSLGSNTQLLVDVHNRHPVAVVGGDSDLSKQRRPSVRPHFDESGWIIQERRIVDFRGMASSHMGNHPTLKWIQILIPIKSCDLLICYREDIMGILRYMMVWKPE